jgi:hypothetical protein
LVQVQHGVSVQKSVSKITKTGLTACFFDNFRLKFEEKRQVFDRFCQKMRSKGCF